MGTTLLRRLGATLGDVGSADGLDGTTGTWGDTAHDVRKEPSKKQPKPQIYGKCMFFSIPSLIPIYRSPMFEAEMETLRVANGDLLEGLSMSVFRWPM